ncbi:hypothetical protein SmJEL517_g04062 [Synchytrium microbalum]|uniref:non-specific serine/threonine protein kinase n=1 Tax=Synchytrium microbalum TaxID=1806994 RepID=A0A507C4I3_9FUNG|nr:uncharacterized protein SmJEL517_g04062 [Synchytrium microbalum]TPX32906.1 hypothetical protein SmJEL517_g04062 [Synchytrium microbalum]
MSRAKEGEPADGQPTNNTTTTTTTQPTATADPRLSETKGPQYIYTGAGIILNPMATSPTAANGVAVSGMTSQRDSLTAAQQQTMDANTSGRQPRAADGQPVSSPQATPAASSAKLHHGSASNQNIVGVHYKVGKKIGEGSFGIIYEGVNLMNNQPIAVKFEPRKSDAPQLRDEYRTYKILSGSVGIPNVYYFGQEGLHNVLCIDLLGPSLEDMFDLCNRKFSLKTVCMAAKQMLSRVQTIHEKNLIYRDIKPDNFLIGRLPRHNEAPLVIGQDPVMILPNHTAAHPHPASIVYIVDFGMAKQYRDPKTKQHIPYREKKSLSGTARYMSINTHLGREQSRRDDLEALGHVFMYFLRGSLPWQGLKAATNKQKYEKIGEKKQSVSVKELCENFPEEFALYLTYVRNLKFEEAPDYDYLKGLLNKVLTKIGEQDDGIYDWMVVMDQQRKEKERQREAEREARERERAERERAYRAFQAANGNNPNATGGPMPPYGVSASSNMAIISPTTAHPNSSPVPPSSMQVLTGGKGNNTTSGRESSTPNNNRVSGGGTANSPMVHGQSGLRQEASQVGTTDAIHADSMQRKNNGNGEARPPMPNSKPRVSSNDGKKKKWWKRLFCGGDSE